MSKSSTGKLDILMKESSFPSTGLRPTYAEYKNGSQIEVVYTVISYMVTSRPSGHLMTRFTVSADPYWWREYLVPSDYEISEWRPLPQSVLKLLIELFELLMDGSQSSGTMTITLDMLDRQNYYLDPTPLSSGPMFPPTKYTIEELWKECLKEVKKLPRWKDWPSSLLRPEGSPSTLVDGHIKVKAEGTAGGLPGFTSDGPKVAK